MKRVLAGLVSFAFVGCLQATEAPNIILIMADDAGYGDLSIYEDFADEWNQTPALDSLAETGLLMTQAYAPAQMCWPTRGSLLTGKWSARWGGGTQVPGKFPKLGTLLRDAGYYTMMVGKTHNGIGEGDMPPTDWGWDRYFMTFTQHDYFYSYTAPGLGEVQFTNAIGYGSGVNNPASSNRLEPVEISPETDRYTQQGWLTREGWNSIEDWRKDAGEKFGTIPYEWALRYAPVLESRADGGFDYVTDFGEYTITNQYTKEEVTAGYLPETFSQKALQFVQEHLDAKPEQPFFLYMPRSVVHVPVHEPPAELIAPERQHLLGKNLNGAGRALMMDILDRNVSELVEILKAKGKFENTIIIFCSDNGGNEQSMGLYRGQKGQFFDGGIRTPFVLSWPAGIPESVRGQINSVPMSLTDLAPTFLAAASSSTEESFDGVDLLPFWKGQQSGLPERFGDSLFWGDGNTKRFAVRHDERNANGQTEHSWKLVRQGNQEYLFDLAADPGEENPLDLPKIRNAMRDRLNLWLVEVGSQTLLE